MKKLPRILIYIIINIIISAITTLTVLWIWDSTQPEPIGFPAHLDSSAEDVQRIDPDDTQTPLPAADLEPTITFIEENPEVNIYAIVGAGDLDVEYVEIRNKSTGPVEMTGWQLIDNQGNQFIFPAMILNSEGAIKVLSQVGNNSVIELYWQSDSPIWQPGETAVLLDAAGETVSTYSIP